MLQDVSLCSLVLQRPLLVTSNDPHATVKRILKILQGWPINSQVTPIPTDGGASVFSLMNLSIENQRSLYKEVRKHKYPLILVSSTDFELDKKLESLLLLNYRDDINESSILPVKPFRFTDLNEIKERVQNITITTEITTYIYDLIVEIRYSRFIKGGIPTYIISDLTDFIRFKTFMINMGYVTPIMVKKCFRIILPLRLHLIEPDDDPSLLYGSNLALVKQLVNTINVNDVIDIAIANVKPPI